ncbi:MAG: hypothetical protein IPI85_01750 [Dehalococcoidia bacterium]|nr:hypothetical protein [Dehalococcoidia bacterium]
MYPYRAGIEKVIVLDDDQWLDAEPYHDRFQWTQKWPRANWTLAYQGTSTRSRRKTWTFCSKT